MDMDRRNLLKWSGATGAVAAGLSQAEAAPAPRTPISALGLDATQFGVRPGSPDDQSTALQRAIDRATSTRVPLALMPGVYRAGDLKLPDGAQIVGVRGATRLVMAGGASLVSSAGTANVTLSGLVLEGRKLPLLSQRGLVHFENASAFRIFECDMTGAGGTAIYLTSVDGEISGNTILDSGEAALFSRDGRGLTVARNTIRGAGNNGIQIWQSASGDDSAMVLDNRVEDIANRSGGSGQYGNGISVFRAANVIVRGNRVRNCKYSAIRGNSANAIQIVGNSVTDLGEVAIFSEFGFQGAIIANNTIDGAMSGLSVTNFNNGGRLAVVSGNIIRNVKAWPNGGGGIGLHVEADTAVTGNVVENASKIGISLGFGWALRDVTAIGNIVRQSAIGMSVSVSKDASNVVIADNVMSGYTEGALIGRDYGKSVTSDLLKGGLERFAHISASGNRAS